MSQSTSLINRSSRSILSFQLQGLSNALRTIVQSGQSTNRLSALLLNKLRIDLLKVTTGPALDDFPIIDDSTQASDLLVMAEVMNETLNAFLSPEEGEEKRKFFGIDRVDLGLGPLSLGLGRTTRS